MSDFACVTPSLSPPVTARVLSGEVLGVGAVRAAPAAGNWQMAGLKCFQKRRKQEPPNPLRAPWYSCMGMTTCLREKGEQMRQREGLGSGTEVSSQSPRCRLVCNLSFLSLPECSAVAHFVRGADPSKYKAGKPWELSSELLFPFQPHYLGFLFIC